MSINCLKCKHYYITWDRRYPRGCKVFGFKARYSLSGAVYNASGVKCLYYEEKIRKKREQ